MAASEMDKTRRMAGERMVLTAFLMPGGYDQRAWRLPDSPAEELGLLEPIVRITQKYEAAKLDAIFIADVISANPILDGDVRLGSPYEPMTALAALAACTSRIGLIGTFSTTFNHPFTLARQLAALDVLSRGRAAWNIVTSSRAEENYGVELPSKVDRYRRAAEFVDVVVELWDAWSDSAVIADRRTGNWVAPGKIRPISHHGEFYNVEGFTNQRRSPQGRPVLVQAGQSSSGRGFGARYAEMIYTAQPELSASKEYYEAYKRLVVEMGRKEQDVRLLPGLVPYIADTAHEARDIKADLNQFIDFDAARDDFAKHYDLDLSRVELDDEIPVEVWGDKDDDTAGTRFTAYRDRAIEERLTLRELLVQVTTGGHLEMIGTASDVADRMVEWFEGRACDGFSLNAPIVPSMVDAVAEKLVPELQNRGYFHADYEGSSMRDSLGLSFPAAWDAQLSDSVS